MAEYVGFDVSKEAAAFCVMDGAGKVLARAKAAPACRVSMSVPGAGHRKPCGTPPALLAESLGKPSLWVNNKDR